MPRVISAALASLLLLLAVEASARRPWHPPRPRPPQVSMQLVDARGRALRTFEHHGSTFVLGDMGQRYAIRLTNHGRERVEVVVSVDGRDVVHGGASAGAGDRGYVVPAFGSTTIEGFRTSLEQVAAFRFTSPGDSFAGRHGQAMRVGEIRAMMFRERRREVVRPRPLAKSKRGAPSRAPSPGAARSASPERRRATRRRPEASNLGTQFGEQTESHVREVSFVRSRPAQADQTLVLRYDDAAGLRARGIRIFAEPPPQPISGWQRVRGRERRAP